LPESSRKKDIDLQKVKSSLSRRNDSERRFALEIVAMDPKCDLFLRDSTWAKFNDDVLLKEDTVNSLTDLIKSTKIYSIENLEKELNQEAEKSYPKKKTQSSKKESNEGSKKQESKLSYDGQILADEDGNMTHYGRQKYLHESINAISSRLAARIAGEISNFGDCTDEELQKLLSTLSSDKGDLDYKHNIVSRFISGHGQW